MVSDFKLFLSTGLTVCKCLEKYDNMHKIEDQDLTEVVRDFVEFVHKCCISYNTRFMH